MKITDKMRLDFLARKRMACRGPYFPRCAPPQWRIRIYPQTYWGLTIRECLDAAIRAEKEGGRR